MTPISLGKVVELDIVLLCFNMLALLSIRNFFSHTITAPAVKRFRALQVNNTTFNFTVEVFYTGGGDLERFSIRLQQSGSSLFDFFTTVVPIQSQTSPRLWYAVVTNSAFENLKEPTFDINVLNTMEQSVVQQVQGEVGKSRVCVTVTFTASLSYSLQIQLYYM